VTSRRAFIATLAGILGAPLVGEAQQSRKISRIGVLNSIPPDHPLANAFLQGLIALGHIDGQTFALEYRWSESDQFRDLASELVRLKVDVIVAPTTPAVRAAREATSTIPIVFAFVGDPVGIGVVSSLARPGGNVTGVTTLTSDLGAKRLQLLREAVPRVSRIAVLWNPDVPDKVAEWDATRAAAAFLNIDVQSVQIRSTLEFEPAFEAITAARAGALIVLGESLMFKNRTRIVAFAAQRRLAIMAGLREFPQAGALMSYGPSLAANLRHCAVYVDRILKGAKPAELPVEQPTTFELVINLKTAKALGLTIPPSVLGRADHLIQ